MPTQMAGHSRAFRRVLWRHPALAHSASLRLGLSRGRTMEGSLVRRWSSLRALVVRASVPALVAGAGLLVPSSALAATATITSIVPSATGGLTVTTNVTLAPSDCSQYGYCGWFMELTAAPAGQSCNPFDAAQLDAVGPVVNNAGTTSVALSASLFQPGTYEICAFADLPNGTDTYLTSATYSTPAVTGSLSVGPEAGGQLGGTIAVDVPYCDTGCDWFLETYEQDDSGPCSAAPSGSLISVGPDELGLGDQTWPYSFTPAVATGVLQVCAYLTGGSLAASSSYAFPASKTVTVKKKPRPKPRLLVATGRTALRQALLKRFKGASSVTLTCRSVSLTKVRCAVNLKRAGFVYRGPATALLSGKVVRMSWALKRVASTRPVVNEPTTPTTTPTSTAPTPTPVSCTPLSNEGTCYEPGEYCRNTDHGLTGVAGDGEAIECEYNNGWRWEPTG